MTLITNRFWTGLTGGLRGMMLGLKGVMPFGMDEWLKMMWGMGGTKYAGEYVNTNTAMQVSAFYACIHVISEDMAKIPLKFYKRREGDMSLADEAPQHPLYSIFNEAANGWMTGMDFREMMQAWEILRGDAYALKVRSFAAGVLSDGKAQIVEMVPIEPMRVKVEWLRDGTPKYYVYPPRNQPGSPKEFSRDDIYHERGLTLDGRCGVSPIQYQAETLGFAIAQTKYGGRIMGNGGKPGGVLSHPGKLRDDARKNLKTSWDEAFGGDNIGKTAVVEEGMSWANTTMKMVDMQYMEIMKLTRTQIAAMMRVPLHKIGDLDGAKYANIEQQSIDYVTDCLYGWAKRRESNIRTQLIDAPNFYYAEHNLDALLRGDLPTRYKAYSIGRQWGWLSANDIRRKENQNPIANGDEYLVPLNMVPAGTDVTKLAQKPGSGTGGDPGSNTNNDNTN